MNRARKALLEQLRSLRPPLPESDIAREETRARRGDRRDRGEIRVAGRRLHPRFADADPAHDAGKQRRARGVATARRNFHGPAPESRLPRPGRPPFGATAFAGRLRQGNPGPSRAQFRARRCDLSRRARRSQPAGIPPQAPTAVRGKPAADRRPTVASPARSQLAAAMANRPLRLAGRRSVGRGEGRQG